ncbi:polysaccharide deacetylase family protein [Halalkalicoccus subterraneus]|uniref:polysaccharide deacetylase family protein n=1 Tax=Halalkalicoccus subterraneus TaxID=2675002 RepID=UPI000EFB2AA3|nr:polysaccharide deacetylase family protein [Halalkalicoccus subterraneus]
MDTESDNGNGNGNGNDTNGNSTGGGNGNETDNETDNGGEPNEAAQAAATEYGEVLDDFEAINWYALRDEQISPDDNQAVTGNQSMSVQLDGNVSTVAWSPSSTLDLTDQYLSAAVKVNSPVGGRLSLHVRAPGGDDYVTSARRLPSAVDQWFRVDFGYTVGYGGPDFSQVQELRFEMVGPEGSPVDYRIDDLRTTPAKDESNVILAFYGGLEEHYETVFPLLEERGWVGALGISQDLLNTSGRLSTEQLREMRDAGWDVCSYPMHTGDLTQYGMDEQRRIVENNRDYLANRGFEEGSQHFFTPRNRMNNDLLNVLRDTHETAYVFGACSSGIPPTGRHTISAISGSSYQSTRKPILRADIHNQVVVPYFETIGEEGMSVEEFEQQLDRIEDNSYGNGLEPITPTQLLENY